MFPLTLVFFGCKHCKSSSYWGIATNRAPFCAKLLRECNFASYCGSTVCRVLLCFKPLGFHSLQGFALCQAISEFQLVAHSSYWGIAISRPLSCVKLLGNYNRVLFGVKLLGNYNLQGFALCQAIGEFQLAVYYFAPSNWGGSCLLPS